MAVWLTAGFVLNSQNVANNTSSVTAWVDANSNYGSYNINDPAPYGEITFWGNSASSGAIGFNHTFNANTNTRLYTRTYTVTHNADGTAAISLSVWFDTQVSSGRVYGEASLTLPTIPRASTPTVTGTKQLGSTMTIATNRASTAFTHTIKWSWAGKSGTIASNVGASTTWTPAIATFAPYLTSGTSSTCTITCDTYNGTALIGTKTTSFTLSVPSSVVPNVASATFSDTKGYYSTYGGYVAGKSNVQMTINATGIYGSSINKYYGRLGTNSTVSGTSKILTVGSPSASGSVPWTATVTDSRGRQDSLTGNLTVLAYSPPNLNGTTAERWNTSSGTSDDESTTIRVTLKGSTTNLGNKGTNVASLKVEYKLTTASTWTTAWSSANAGVSFNTGYNISNCAVTNSYDIRVTATDKLGESVVKTLQVGTAQPVMDFRTGGKGVAIGRVSTADDFSVGFPSNFYDDVTFHKPIKMNNGFTSISIPANSDLNDYTIPGFYHCPMNTTAATIANSPSTSAFSLQVYKNALTLQRLTKYQSGQAQKTYERNQVDNGTWGSWRTLVYTDCYDSIYLQPEQWIGWRSANTGANMGLMTVNSSNIVEFQWTSGGLQGHVRRQIWTGTWSVGGTITVTNGLFYNMFLIYLTNATMDRVIATRQNRGGTASNIVGVGGVLNGAIYVNAIRISTNNNNWTLNGCRVGALNNPGGETNATITRIDGII